MKANVNISRFVTVLDNLDKKGNRVAGLIMSHAGLGKTSTLRMFCDCNDYNLFTLIPSSFASDDILGLQTVDKGHLKRLTPSWYDELVDMSKNGKRTMLFIDELSTCDPYVQAPLLDLIFSRKLGSNELPKNVFIISSGNYSEDLNGEFKMSCPMVNRFMVLNINSKDIDVDEILDNSFDNLKTKEEKKKFLGIDKFDGSEYSYKAFLKWVKDNKEIAMGRSFSSEDSEYGLMGFTSVRSIDYSLKFTQEYMASFSDTLWINVVGDTLGYSNKRDNIPMRTVLLANESFFYARDEELLGLSELCKMALENGLSTKLKAKLEQAIKSMNSYDITDSDTELFTKTIQKYANDRDVAKLLSLFTSKLNH